MAQTNPPAGLSGLALIEAYARVVWRRRRLIAVQSAVICVLTVITVLLLPSWYRARTELMPPEDSDGGMSLTSLLAGVKVPGVSLPGAATTAQVYTAILRSRWVCERIIHDYDLQKVYKAKFLDDAIGTLRKRTGISTSDEGTLVIAVEDRDRERAARMANSYVSYLDEFNREHRTTRGHTLRVFTEKRLRQTADSLALAERALADYESTHKSGFLGAGMSEGMDASARLVAERMAAAVKLDALRASYAAGAPEVREVENALAALDRQLARVPQAGVEAARLYRGVKVNEQLFALLTAQFEEARILEARDTPTVDVIDRAVPPQRRAKPKRAQVVLTAAALSVVWGIMLAFVLEARDAKGRA